MPEKTDNSDKAFRELIRVLEDAIQAGADSVGLEYEDRNWIVYHNFGNTGLGAARIAKELQWDVINEIHKRAGLSRKARGKMQISLLGKDYEVAVKTHESFGESVYHLTLKERQEKEAVTVQKKKKKKNPASKACARFVGNLTRTCPRMIFSKRMPWTTWMTPCIFSWTGWKRHFPGLGSRDVRGTRPASEFEAKEGSGKPAQFQR